ncbi:MAG: tyrosine--tRNA ligase [Brevinematales bacterium]|nr:tyrosine--tRNA ligase [Brevinematales bacterium]
MAFPSVEEQLSLLTRGVVDIVPFEDLKKKLERSCQENVPLRVKFGADPSAPDLHLGHTVVLRKLRQFQKLGHHVIFLIGDFTGMIGDPTGKSTTRKRLSREEVLANAETYKTQIFKILDPDRTEIVFNSSWCSEMRFAEVLDLTARYTVARLLEREDFGKRYREGKPISLIEFMYPLIQGYDSVALRADVELGGTDQTFNLMVGRELQKEYGQESQVILTMPILEGTDGTQKMSKSLGNYIGINEPPSQIFGKIMSIPDTLILKYFELLTDVSPETLKRYEQEMKQGANPRDYKILLAKEIVGFYYSKSEAEACHEEFERIFRQGGTPDEMPIFSLSSPMALIDILVQSGTLPSRSEVRRMVQQQAVSLDGERVSSETVVLHPGQERVIKVGKRKFLRVQ